MKRIVFLATFLVAAVLFLASPEHVNAQGPVPDDGGDSIIDVVDEVNDIAPFMWGNRVEVSNYKGIAVHHTVGGSSWKSVVTNHLSWSRPPYMLVVEKSGRVYQLAVFGSQTFHAGCAKEVGGKSCNNKEYASISLVGDFRYDVLSSAQRKGLMTAIRYLISKGVPANIVGHQDLPDSATVCPGPNIITQLSSIRAEVGSSSGKIPAIVKPVEPPSIAPKVTSTPKVQPAKIFGFPLYADSACERNMRTALAKASSWEILAGRSESFIKKFGTFFGKEYVPALGVAAGCLCEVATIFNYVAADAGLKVAANPPDARHKKFLVVPGVPKGYEIEIWETNKPESTWDMSIKNVSTQTVTIRWTVYGDEIRMWTEGSSSSKSSSSSAPKQPAVVTTPAPGSAKKTTQVPPASGTKPETGVTPEPPAASFVETMDKIADSIKWIPGVKWVADGWYAIKAYLPWVMAGIVMFFILTIVRPFIGWLANTRWGRKHNRKKKEFFWLSAFILLAYEAKKDAGMDDPFLLQMFIFVVGLWGFLVLIGWLYAEWRRFNYDPDMEEVIEAGGADRYEWVKSAILGPVILGYLVLIFAFIFGYSFFGSGVNPIEAFQGWMPQAATPPARFQSVVTPVPPPVSGPPQTQKTEEPSRLVPEFNFGTPLLDIPEDFKQEVRSLGAKVAKISEEVGVPAEVPFVLWLKEAGGHRVNPGNGEGLCGFHDLKNSGREFKPGKIESEEELLYQLKLCAEIFKAKGTTLSYWTTDPAVLGTVYMNYNGNRDCHDKPYSSWAIHPYVMNGMSSALMNMTARAPGPGPNGEKYRCVQLVIIGALPAHARIGNILRGK